MKKDLRVIQDKVRDIQVGLLQVRDHDKKTSFPVRATASDNDTLDCVVNDISLRKKLMNRHVSLIQKYKDDYVYIVGKVQGEVNRGNKILSVHILKASWFVRKFRGGVSWLQEKYVYENYQPQDLELAS